LIIGVAGLIIGVAGLIIGVTGLIIVRFLKKTGVLSYIFQVRNNIILDIIKLGLME
jgi:hypothetical protein